MLRRRELGALGRPAAAVLVDPQVEDAVPKVDVVRRELVLDGRVAHSVAAHVETVLAVRIAHEFRVSNVRGNGGTEGGKKKKNARLRKELALSVDLTPEKSTTVFLVKPPGRPATVYVLQV